MIEPLSRNMKVAQSYICKICKGKVLLEYRRYGFGKRFGLFARCRNCKKQQLLREIHGINRTS